MGERTITKRVCDRPGCAATVTANGGRFCIVVDGVATVQSPVADGVDLCRACAESLRLWWTARERREAKARGGRR